MFQKKSLSFTILTLAVLPVLLLGVATTVFAGYFTNHIMVKDIEKNLAHMTYTICMQFDSINSDEYTLEDDVLKKGDVIFIEAGTVHAINEGILILEIQQSSNATYRLYDYDRVDANGQKRELHLEKAFDNMILQKKEIDASPAGEIEVQKGYTKQVLGACKYFSAISYDVEECAQIGLDDSTFRSIVFVEGEGIISTTGCSLSFKAGDSFFVPAGKKVLSIEGKSRFILSHV